MRAVVVRQYGGPENLELVDVVTPEPGRTDVRIKVAAAAVQPVDGATRAGFFEAILGALPEVGIGWDAAGVIDAVGTDVTQFRPGDKVVALLDTLATKLGTYADYVVVPAAAAAPAPSSADFVAASTLPLNALTAEQALDLLALEPGQTLLVTGAAGGLGGYAVPLARRRGLRVVATAGALDEQTVRGFGATDFVSRTEAPAAAVRALFPDGVDGAIDSAQIGTAALDAVRDGGGFVAVTKPDTPEPARGINVQTVQIHHDGKRLADLVELVDAGELELRVTTTLPLAEAAEAHRLLDKGGLRGRIVLVP